MVMTVMTFQAALMIQAIVSDNTTKATSISTVAVLVTMVPMAPLGVVAPEIVDVSPVQFMRRLKKTEQ